jgi:hypothetical protein
MTHLDDGRSVGELRTLAVEKSLIYLVDTRRQAYRLVFVLESANEKYSPLE